MNDSSREYEPKWMKIVFVWGFGRLYMRRAAGWGAVMAPVVRAPGAPPYWYGGKTGSPRVPVLEGNQGRFELGLPTVVGMKMGQGGFGPFGTPRAPSPLAAARTYSKGFRPCRDRLGSPRGTWP